MSSYYCLQYIFVASVLLLISTVSGCSPKKTEHSIRNTQVVGVLAESRVLANNQELASIQMDVINDSVRDLQFSEFGRGVAYQFLRNEKPYVVHNGTAGKPYDEILYLAMSRDGVNAAYAVKVNAKWRMVHNDTVGPYFDEVGMPVFSRDGVHLMYDAKIGEQWNLVVDGKLNNDPCSSYYSKLFSSDGTKTIALENSGPENSLSRVVVRDIKHNKLNEMLISGTGVKFNHDKSRFALQNDQEGKKRVLVVSSVEPKIVSEGRLFDEISRFAFGSDGVSFSYVAVRDDKPHLVVNEVVEQLTAGMLTMEAPVARPGGKGAAIALTGRDGAFIYFSGGSARQQKRYEEAVFPAFDATGKSYAYCARNGRNMFYVINGKESPVFDKVLAPIFSPDGTRVVARVRKDGKRFMIVMDLNANLLSQHPAYDMVYQPTFTADGKSVAYGVKDGSNLSWKVEKL